MADLVITIETSCSALICGWALGECVSAARVEKSATPSLQYFYEAASRFIYDSA